MQKVGVATELKALDALGYFFFFALIFLPSFCIVATLSGLQSFKHVLIIIDNFGESFYSVCSVQGIVSVKSIGI
jgi:hypothetical protein